MRGWFPAASILLLVACGSNGNPPTPAPGTGTGETITGRERIGWDQAASGATDIGTYRFAIYVNNARSELADVTCATAAGPTGFACSARLPMLAPGSHLLEVAAVSGGIEGPRSAPLQVTVAGASTPVGVSPLSPGEVLSTTDGARLQAELLIDDLADVVDITLSPGGPLLVGERGGSIVFRPLNGDAPAFRATTAAAVLAVSASPDFAATGHVYVLHDATTAVRLTRYRLFNTQLVERMSLIPDVAASAEASGALRFGHDTKLYAAFSAVGDAEAANRMSDWRGKILRLNPDGRTPDDQPAGSPVYWTGLSSPHGLAWAADGMLWMVERGPDGIERLRAIAADGRPRRAGQRATYVLPGEVGASSLAFHTGAGAAHFAGNLFVAAREGQYLLRVRFDDTDRLKAMTSEKLLEGRLGELRAVAIAPDGALYVATPSTVWRLTPVRD